ncbi:hypothetical protein MC7420_882 [Coleofasciculus chthonoplastes PCC 7420]|uniref:Peptidase S8/S53 domain-containing protein n=1 Tax=Coleofasciculus chthonoplastes PCC 7420 TaxID=118168 RepID=B4VT74_9CYAN|nr:hypothetical protein [Coleofasciculus chthonoplastes]EDX75008.1 hypothetical protein MC7420_882 [Coleofasciculus chthonoplastes PCC 7420]
MVDFPHIPLRLTREGTAVFTSGGRKPNPQTTTNLSDRWGHGNRLKNSTASIVSAWQDIQQKREEEEKPPLPDAQRIILQIDPDAFDPDDLKTYGIEVIAELENGYIIGASADLELSDLRNKIEKFINEEWGGKKVSEIWDIIEGFKKPEYILSPELLAHWNQVKDDQIYIVDVGIACIGTKVKLSDYPKRKPDESNEKFNKRVNDWLDKRSLTYEEWDDLADERQQGFIKFIQDEAYKGQVIISFVESNIPRLAKSPDSFSCRIQISGKGLKDLVFNFPFIFDVSEPDQFAEIRQQSVSNVNEPPLILQPPQSNAPKVCIIDSGIQERHSLLRTAIDEQNSKSWVLTGSVVKEGKIQIVSWQEF